MHRLADRECTNRHTFRCPIHSPPYIKIQAKLRKLHTRELVTVVHSMGCQAHAIDFATAPPLYREVVLLGRGVLIIKLKKLSLIILRVLKK